MTSTTTSPGPLRLVLDEIAASRGTTLEAVAEEARRQGHGYTVEELATGAYSGYGDALDAVLGLTKDERARIVPAWWAEVKAAHPINPNPPRPYTRHEEPEPGGCVLRGRAATNVRGYRSAYPGERVPCGAGAGCESVLLTLSCDNPAIMEVYGVWLCEAHGEESAAGALEEIAYDLEQELPRPINPHVRDLSPHIEAALQLGYGVLENVNYEDASYKALLAAFPMGGGTVDAETVAYSEDPDAEGRGIRDSPLDAYLRDRIVVHRHMRLAYENGADWLVEVLETERVQVAAQAAYALALDGDMLRPTGPETPA